MNHLSLVHRTRLRPPQETLGRHVLDINILDTFRDVLKHLYTAMSSWPRRLFLLHIFLFSMGLVVEIIEPDRKKNYVKIMKIKF